MAERILELIEQAIEQGSSPEEIQVLIAQNLESIDSLESSAFSNWRKSLTPEKKKVFDIAFVGAKSYGEEKDSGLLATLFGDPESQLQTGTGPLLPPAGAIGPALAKPLAQTAAAAAGRAIGGAAFGASVGAARLANQNILNRLGQTLLRSFLPKKMGGFPLSGKVGMLWAGAAGFGVGQAIAGGNFAPGNQGSVAPVSRTPGAITQGPESFRTADRTLGPGASPSAKGLLSEVPKGFNVMVVDHDGRLTGTPGALAVITPADLGMDPFIDPATQAAIGVATDIGSLDVQQGFADFQVGNPQGLAGQNANIHQALFPPTVGDVRITTPTVINSTSSLGGGRGSINPAVQPFGDRLQAVGVKKELADWVQGLNKAPGMADFGAIVENDPTGSKPVQLPANAEIQPRAFESFGGRTLVEHAEQAARRHGVPLNLLYGLVAHESGWDRNAVGDNGQSHGLVQIYQPTWGEQISPAQSRNPLFALNWAAKMMRERFNTYGTWEAAVAAHNSPVAANYLADTGKYQNAKSAKYVQDIFNRANRSGLANALFDDAGESFTFDDSSGSGTGPTVTPFAEPDPAQSRAYAQQQYLEMLGREPTEDEYAKEVKRLRDLAFRSYQQQVKAALGQESQEVDVASQFAAGIQEMGEFGFHKEMQQTRSFTDHAAGFARMLQQGI